MKRNQNFQRLSASYLFPEIARRAREFEKNNPGVKLQSLGIGDTTKPLERTIADVMSRKAQDMGTAEGYRGYGPESGEKELRELIQKRYYPSRTVDEIFVSDGAKCDVGRLTMLFGSGRRVAIQDPAYPVYVDASLLSGADIHLMPCTPENNFCPNLKAVPLVDLIYLCNPNNPTGHAMSFSELTSFVEFAKASGAIIIYDAAYSAYIQDPKLPKSIYEIPGAEKVAIEVNSFSKLAGFTGMRLGWTVVPKDLSYDDGTPIQPDWERIHTTLFNGASNLIQWGGIAALNTDLKAIQTYLENASKLKAHFGGEIYGGEHAPFLWARYPNNTSWEIFDFFLNEHHLITTPGSGFGPSGESFIRLSSFGSVSGIKRDVPSVC